MEEHAVVLFDGVCNLCSGAVRFIIRRDKAGYFRFASLQGRSGGQLLSDHGMDAYMDGIVLIEHGRAYTRSDAALRICRRLGGAWPLLGLLRAVPRLLRDRLYGFIARNRYRWFGKQEACMLPSPDIRARFLAD